MPDSQIHASVELDPTSTVEEVPLCLFDPSNSLLEAVEAEMEVGF